jgi:hypothetical protein
LPNNVLLSLGELVADRGIGLGLDRPDHGETMTALPFGIRMSPMRMGSLKELSRAS